MKKSIIVIDKSTTIGMLIGSWGIAIVLAFIPNPMFDDSGGIGFAIGLTLILAFLWVCKRKTKGQIEEMINDL